MNLAKKHWFYVSLTCFVNLVKHQCELEKERVSLLCTCACFYCVNVKAVCLSMWDTVRRTNCVAREPWESFDQFLTHTVLSHVSHEAAIKTMFKCYTIPLSVGYKLHSFLLPLVY